MADLSSHTTGTNFLDNLWEDPIEEYKDAVHKLQGFGNRIVDKEDQFKIHKSSKEEAHKSWKSKCGIFKTASIDLADMKKQWGMCNARQYHIEENVFKTHDAAEICKILEADRKKKKTTAEEEMKSKKEAQNRARRASAAFYEGLRATPSEVAREVELLAAEMGLDVKVKEELREEIVNSPEVREPAMKRVMHKTPSPIQESTLIKFGFGVMNNEANDAGIKEKAKLDNDFALDVGLQAYHKVEAVENVVMAMKLEQEIFMSKLENMFLSGAIHREGDIIKKDVEKVKKEDEEDAAVKKYLVMGELSGEKSTSACESDDLSVIRFVNNVREQEKLSADTMDPYQKPVCLKRSSMDSGKSSSSKDNH